MRSLPVLLLCFTGCTHHLAGHIELAPARDVVFSGVQVFDGEAALGERDVRVSGGVVKEVAAKGSLTPVEGEDRIDGTGKTLLPGLVDAHGHLEGNGDAIWAAGLADADAVPQAYLYAGVTTVLVMQGAKNELATHAKVKAGELPGPRLYMSGPRMTAPDGFPINLYRALLFWPLSTFATSAMKTAATVEEANALVDWTKEQFSPAFYKLTCDSFPPGAPKLDLQVMAAGIARAKADGMRPVAHIGAPDDIVFAAEHGLELFAHPPTSATFSEAQLAVLAEKRIPFVSTQRFLSAPAQLGADHGSPLERELGGDEMLQKFSERPKDFRYPAVPDGMDADGLLVSYSANLKQNLAMLFKAGVPVFAGTDSGSPGVIPGASIHRELSALVAAGLTPVEALRAATSAPADFLDPAHGYGRIAPGQQADLLLVNGDPTTDIAASANVVEVFQAGRRLSRTRQ